MPRVVNKGFLLLHCEEMTSWGRSFPGVTYCHEHAETRKRRDGAKGVYQRKIIREMFCTVVGMFPFSDNRTLHLVKHAKTVKVTFTPCLIFSSRSYFRVNKCGFLVLTLLVFYAHVYNYLQSYISFGLFSSAKPSRLQEANTENQIICNKLNTGD